MQVLAVSLDLDDTLWPVAPAIDAAEAALDAWLRRHHAAVAQRWPIAAMRELREGIARRHPQLAHDFSAQRRLTLAHAFASCGLDETPVEAAYAVYFQARNQVTCYADAVPALAALGARLPLVSLSNGNADLGRIGLRQHFAHCISAREFGRAKPDAAIFHEACARLGIAPANVLHVGDDPELDVAGARRAGLRSAWINRTGAAPPAGAVAADLEFPDLSGLVRWLDGAAAHGRPPTAAPRRRALR